MPHLRHPPSAAVVVSRTDGRSEIFFTAPVRLSIWLYLRRGKIDSDNTETVVDPWGIWEEVAFASAAAVSASAAAAAASVVTAVYASTAKIKPGMRRNQTIKPLSMSMVPREPSTILTDSLSTLQSSVRSIFVRWSS